LYMPPAKGERMSITDVSKELTAVLMPILPLLTTAGTKAVEEVGKGLGGSTLEKVRDLWTKMRAVGKSDSGLSEIASKVAESPSDERLQVRLSCEIAKML